MSRCAYKKTNNEPPLRILSLDAGGVRGYSMLVILRELMHNTFTKIHGHPPRCYQIPRPCDHFDLIVGTGTGGLIAIMLGRLRMDLAACMATYAHVTRRVFEFDKHTLYILGASKTLYSASNLEAAIQECVRTHTVGEVKASSSVCHQRPSSRPKGSIRSHSSRIFSMASRRRSQPDMLPMNAKHPDHDRHGGDEDALLYDDRENSTKTAVVAMYQGQTKNKKPALLRSYLSRAEPDAECECSIWQAGRATSATAPAFKPIKIGQSIFADEGEGKFNPAPDALREAVEDVWPGREVGLFMSIGSGKKTPSTKKIALSEAFSRWSGVDERLEDCETTHKEMPQHLSRHKVNGDDYYRLNATFGVGDYRMNEWEDIDHINTNTLNYVRSDDVKTTIVDAAEKLARLYWANCDSKTAQDQKPYPWPPPTHCINGYILPSDPVAAELPAEDVALPARSPTACNNNNNNKSDVYMPSSPYHSASFDGGVFASLPNNHPRHRHTSTGASALHVNHWPSSRHSGPPPALPPKERHDTPRASMTCPRGNGSASLSYPLVDLMPVGQLDPPPRSRGGSSASAVGVAQGHVSLAYPARERSRPPRITVHGTPDFV